MPRKKPALVPPPQTETAPPLKLILGAGVMKQEGFIAVDYRMGFTPDQTVILRAPEWPWEDGSVEQILCPLFFHFLTGPERINFMNECWRIMKVGAQLVIIVPHWNTGRAYQDPFHAWPPVSELSFYYFNKGWREQQGLVHYGIIADFDWSYGYVLDPETQAKHQDAQAFWLKHYANAAVDVHVTLTKKA